MESNHLSHFHVGVGLLGKTAAAAKRTPTAEPAQLFFGTYRPTARSKKTRVDIASISMVSMAMESAYAGYTPACLVAGKHEKWGGVRGHRHRDDYQQTAEGLHRASNMTPLGHRP